MEETENIESKTAKTILEEPIEVDVAGVRYTVPRPSAATLILVSEAISRLPRYKMGEKPRISDALAYARDCKPLGDILAILILGAKALRKKDSPGIFRRLFRRKRTSAMEKLSARLLEELSPKELNGVMSTLLNSLQLGDFFRAYHFPDRDKSDEDDESGKTDSIWATIAIFAKTFKLPFDYVLYDMTYANIMLYNGALPSYSSNKNKSEHNKNGKSFQADGPDNQKRLEDFFKSIKE